MNFKLCLILSLCPLPNFIILLYYLIAFKVVIESEEVEACQNIYCYNILSLIFFIFSNFYLITQICYEKPKIFFDALNVHFVLQIIWYSALCILIVLGLTFLIDDKRCLDENSNLYNLGITNIVLEIILWIVSSGFTIYYTQIHYKVNPKNEIVCQPRIMPMEETL